MGTSRRTFLAVDLGASSGRVVAGHFDGARIELEELHRFPNGGVSMNDRLYWNVLGLWTHIQEGMRRAHSELGDAIQSVGVDTWGVDFALLGKDGNLLSNPLCYRDAHTDGILDEAFAMMSREEIFAESGLQFMDFNTLYQLARHEGEINLAAAGDGAESFLMIPDLFHWLLTGRVKSNEYTNATTTQLLQPHEAAVGRRPLLERFGLPTHILGTTTRARSQPRPAT